MSDPSITMIAQVVTAVVVAVGAAFTALGVMFQAFMAFQLEKLKLQAKIAADQATAAALKVEAAAVEVKEVKHDLASQNAATGAKIEGLVVVSQATNVTLGEVQALVSSAMSAQSQISALALRRVADLVKDPDDIAAAELAEKAFRGLEVKQRLVDHDVKQEPAGS